MIKIKKWAQIGIISTLLVSIGLYTGVYFMYKKVSSKNILVKNTTQEKNCFDTNFEMIDGIKNILIVGTDTRGGDEPTRADAIMILSVDKSREKMKLVSIMRDTYVKIRNRNFDKINHSYAYGGVELLKDTIESNYGINIDNHVVIDFNGFKEVVDSVGGVEIGIKDLEVRELNRCIKLEIQEDENLSPSEKKELLNNVHLINESGTHNLNGYQALAYTRIRKVGNGCYGRSQRQRYVINTLIDKMKNVSFLRYPFIAKETLKYVQLDFKLNEIVNTAYTVSRIPMDSMEQLYIPTAKLSYGTLYRNKGWVLLNDIERNSRVLQNFIFNDEKYAEENYRRFNVKNSQYWPLKRRTQQTRDVIKPSEEMKEVEEIELIDINKKIEEIFNNNY